jgi:hypothetical protein
MHALYIRHGSVTASRSGVSADRRHCFPHGMLDCVIRHQPFTINYQLNDHPRPTLPPPLGHPPRETSSYVAIAFWSAVAWGEGLTPLWDARDVLIVQKSLSFQNDVCQKTLNAHTPRGWVWTLSIAPTPQHETQIHNHSPVSYCSRHPVRSLQA